MSMKGCTHIFTPLGNYDNKLESKIANKESGNLKTPKTCMSETFNLRYIWHNRIATNMFPNCIDCNKEENITIALLFGPYIKRFWYEVGTFAKELEYDSMHIEDKDKKIGAEQHDKENERFNIIILIAKKNLQMQIEGYPAQ